MTGFNADEIKRNARNAVKSGLYSAGELVITKSLEKVPRDTGKLTRSIYMKSFENELSLEVGYSIEYATDVHEKSEEKFLTQPFHEAKAKILSIIKDKTGEAIR